MNRRKIIGLFLCFIVTLVGTVSCSESSTNTSSEPVQLTISAAISMKDALQEVGEVYQQENPNTKLSFNFGSSGALQQQIEQGANVDVFISAAPKQMNALEEKNLLLEGTRQDLLKNEVVLLVPKNVDDASITNFQDLTSDRVKRFSIGDPGSVPAGQYGQEVLTSLKLYDRVKPKIVFAKDVRQVLSYIETGNVDAGIVYATDALASDKVKVVAKAPEDTHKPIIYPVAVIKSSKNTAAAKEFLQFLETDQAKEIFEKYGFSIPS